MAEAKKKTVDMMATHTLGADLMALVLQEVKVLPNVWPKLNQRQQGDVIDRVRAGVDEAVRKAVQIIMANGRDVIICELEDISIKKRVVAKIEISKGNSPEVLDDAFHSYGKPCLLIISNFQDYMGGMEDIRPTKDQADFFEKDNESMEGDSNRQEQEKDVGGGGTLKSQDDLIDGSGEPEDKPEELPGPDVDPDENEAYQEAVRLVVVHQKCSESWLRRAANIGQTKARRFLERMEKEGIISAEVNGNRTVLRKPSDLE